MLYKEIDYIESSGTQYIDTNYYPNPNTTVKMIFELTKINQQNSIFRSGLDFWYGLYVTGGLNIAYTYKDDTGNFQSTEIAAKLNEKYNVLLDGKNKVLKINDNVFDLTGLQATKTASKTLPLFGRITAASDYHPFQSYLKIYSCQIYDNDVLIRNYIPGIKSDGKIGMYDVVNDVFYQNAGTGEFIPGNEVE